MIPRLLENNIRKRLNDNKAIILLGARQVGKTTLLNYVTANKENVLYWNGDDTDIREMLANPTSTRLKSYIGKNTTLIIDEAQRVKNIGICIKLIVDTIKD